MYNWIMQPQKFHPCLLRLHCTAAELDWSTYNGTMVWQSAGKYQQVSIELTVNTLSHAQVMENMQIV